MANARYRPKVPKRLRRELDAVAREAKLSTEGKGRITNVNPLPKAILRHLYGQPDDDEDSITAFIAAQGNRVEK